MILIGFSIVNAFNCVRIVIILIKWMKTNRVSLICFLMCSNDFSKTQLFSNILTINWTNELWNNICILYQYPSQIWFHIRQRCLFKRNKLRGCNDSIEKLHSWSTWREKPNKFRNLLMYLAKLYHQVIISTNMHKSS